jgi:DUF3047 family protein
MRVNAWAAWLARLVVVMIAATAAAADQAVIEDWSKARLGVRGIPPGWTGQNWGHPAYDLTVEEDNGRRVLHLRSRDEGSTITKELGDRVRLARTPVLEWSWKVVTLPQGGDSRHKETDDQAAQIYVAWPRFPEALRSRIIGYVWDTTAPAGTVVRSEKTATVTYVVVRSGSGDLGRWLTERRNVVEDFERIYGEKPTNPGAVSVAIDSNDTHSTAESYIGEIAFTP